MGLLSSALAGDSLAVLRAAPAPLLTAYFKSLSDAGSASLPPAAQVPAHDVLAVGIAALAVFLQATVTGPALAEEALRGVFAWDGEKGFKKQVVDGLVVDGVAPYQYAPYLEVFGLARFCVLGVSGGFGGSADGSEPPQGPENDLISSDGHKVSLAWSSLRILVWHYKLLAQPNLGSRSTFARSSQWTDVPQLLNAVSAAVVRVRSCVLGNPAWSRREQAELLLEIANSFLMLGVDDKAREALREATEASGLRYKLTGALGKKTKFQLKDTSQLVVFARSESGPEPEASPEANPDAKAQQEARPEALQLNDDTLLEKISFSASGQKVSAQDSDTDLDSLSPDNQPQLDPLDEAILLTEATIRDTFSPLDGLTSEEVLPYAVRVLADKNVNWQIYTQALIVRSRIEVNRSRTVERGILQLQAVVDQIVVDTTEKPEEKVEEEKQDSKAPALMVTAPDAPVVAAPAKPTSFFPALKEKDSAPAPVRLRYVNSLLTPPRWHLESELAHCWAGVGSLISALEIFKRLRMWAEVALCLASAEQAGNQEDGSGRGSGGELKARGIIRWRLFERTDGRPSLPDTPPRDPALLRPAEFMGPLKSVDKLPADAPRLFCILGDLENDSSHYESAWTVSKCRYSRAQKNLGEHYIQQKKLPEACDAYTKAVAVNRLSPELWSRLGDLQLRLANYEEAAEAYTRAIGAANGNVGGEDARTWSNLGSALWSLYREAVAEIAAGRGKRGEEKKKKKEEEEEKQKGEEEKKNKESGQITPDQDDLETALCAIDSDYEDNQENDDDDEFAKPAKLLQQALSAFKRGATLSRDNWRIQDNIITLAARMRPPSLPDIVSAMQRIAAIRASEDALDAAVLRLLVAEGVTAKEKVEEKQSEEDQTTSGQPQVYKLPPGSIEKSICTLLESDIVPLITHRDDLWEIVARARAWRRDYAGAIDAAESAWRAAVGATSAGGSLAAAASTNSSAHKDWLKDANAWENVVVRTDELVSMLENYGEDVPAIGGKWRFRARNAVRSVMGKARGQWEGSEGWQRLEGVMAGLKS
ncbi:hypothetical protein TD95_004612 [Thielaviopsis punctulata]|uniref:Uncharacterized protein n=1 Tax=Thielaviopsis punctulata TaxID=72032 RepID=A0A0F4ZFP6_9PEZI|nr:hypothetical protein TD95_004612 [Thielaviopsis punctulata]